MADPYKVLGVPGPRATTKSRRPPQAGKTAASGPQSGQQEGRAPVPEPTAALTSSPTREPPALRPGRDRRDGNLRLGLLGEPRRRIPSWSLGTALVAQPTPGSIPTRTISSATSSGSARAGRASRCAAPTSPTRRRSISSKRCRGAKNASPCPDGKTLDINIPRGHRGWPDPAPQGTGPAWQGGPPTATPSWKSPSGPIPPFERDGRDILLECPISLTEAVLGGTITVPTIDGKVALKGAEAQQHRDPAPPQGQGDRGCEIR